VVQGLMRDIRRDRRAKALRSLLLLAVCGAFGIVLFLDRREPSAATTLPPVVPVDSAAAVAPQPESAPLSYTVRRGDTFAGILSQFGIFERSAIACYKGLRAAGLTALFPGDSLVIDTGKGGTLKSLSLRNRSQHWFRMRRDRDSVRIERRPVATTVMLSSVRGVLTRSLSEDLFELGEGDGLVAAITDMFAWDINFFTDPRAGDRFEALFEKKFAEGKFLGYGEVHAARYTTSSRTFSAYGLRDSTGAMRYYDGEGNSVQKQFLKAPLRYSRISSGYSMRRKHPILGIYRPHQGVDYAAARGTPVHAAADGVVVSAGWKGGFGKLVTLRHGSYITMYGHLHRIASGIAAGTRVVQGQMIGTVGSTGLSTGPHLDYRMQVNGRFVNPLSVDLPSGEPVAQSDRETFERSRDRCALILDQRFGGHTGSYTVAVETPDAVAAEQVTLGEDATGGHGSSGT
jgi:murein DD-endopeptidase MepM/ murein hydrolase activator NlpD